VLKLYASDARNILIAGVRDPAGATEVNTLAKSSPAAIHVVKIVAGDEEGNQAAAAEVAAKVGRVDVLWANAGRSTRICQAPDSELTCMSRYLGRVQAGPADDGGRL
jgi:NAD(P)-dependent dehydrogenase (short-subunit alcohol dehydrogenase family)